MLERFCALRTGGTAQTHAPSACKLLCCLSISFKQAQFSSKSRAGSLKDARFAGIGLEAHNSLSYGKES